MALIVQTNNNNFLTELQNSANTTAIKTWLFRKDKFYHFTKSGQWKGKDYIVYETSQDNTVTFLVKGSENVASILTGRFIEKLKQDKIY